ncbi:hypothetical protein COOONC_10785 [Cooperia oncophora]
MFILKVHSDVAPDSRISESLCGPEDPNCGRTVKMPLQPDDCHFLQKQYFALRTAHADKLAELNKRPSNALPSRKEIVDSLKVS